VVARDVRPVRRRPGQLRADARERPRIRPSGGPRGVRQHRAEAIASGKAFLDEFRIRRPDGSQVWIGYQGRAEYGADGKPLRTLGIVMDISERKHVEQILRDADQQKDDFIATLSHELRNPLAPIRNAVDILRHIPPTDPRVAWCHGIIRRQTDQMSRLLEDLLDVSRLSRPSSRFAWSASSWPRSSSTRSRSRNR
jgi:signal transduction histidine kinase